MHQSGIGDTRMFPWLFLARDNYVASIIEVGPVQMLQLLGFVSDLVKVDEMEQVTLLEQMIS